MVIPNRKYLFFSYIFRFFASMVMGIEFDQDGAGGGAGGGVDRIVPT